MQSVFVNFDVQLRGERGPNGEPSSYDFQSHELFKIVERFAEDWDRLPKLILGRSDYRILIGTGVLVRAFVVTGQLAPDGAIELVGIDIELGSGEQ